AGPRPFQRLADEHIGEFAQLAGAIGEMLARLETTADRLRTRERAFESLYQLAPSAMISLDVTGQIIEANRRAAELLMVRDEVSLVGRNILDLVMPEDRVVLRQTVDRLEVDHSPHGEIRMTAGDQIIHVSLDCAGVRDETGSIQSVRLSLRDISLSRKLQRDLEDKSRLLNLIIDHMSDGILLVDANGRIAACNRRLATLLHSQPQSLTGLPYDPEHLWDDLGLVEPALFLSRLQQIEGDLERPAQERFESRAGTFQFQGIPVQDTAGHPVGRLWVVQEITSQVQSQRLLNQQTQQLQAIRLLGQELAQVTDTDQFLLRAEQQLYDALGVEVVGLALRRAQGPKRSLQLLHRGSMSVSLDINRQIIETVECHLMPQILHQDDVMFWAEVPRSTPWGKVFHRAGLTCLAGAPLRGLNGPIGILWIARRGGEHIERQHIYLLEAMLPLLASRVEVSSLFDRLGASRLADPVTGLATEHQFHVDMLHRAMRPEPDWGIAMVRIEHHDMLLEVIGQSGFNDLMRQMSASICRVIRRNCTVARLDDATLAILTPDASEENLGRLAQRLRDAIGRIEAGLCDGHVWKLEVHIGTAQCPTDGTDPERLLALAISRLHASGHAMPAIANVSGS
ncbi:MAG: PAS domain-containing protein, partial [Phycisphaeraceae bacterium]|nr:PAS domain-containing protein [Phycisphaeraceae bacterium]